MPKVIIEFNLPEEDYEYNLATNASRYHGILWDFQMWLRNKVKYENRTEFEEVRTEFNELCREHGVDL